MPTDDDLVLCADCRAPLPDFASDARKPCPACGGTATIQRASIFSTGVFHEMHRVRQKRPGTPGYLIDERGGDDFHRDSGTWRTVDRSIDKQAAPPWYRELIVDKETKEVIRDVSEPLSQHVGRGSAKPKSSPATRDDASTPPDE